MRINSTNLRQFEGGDVVKQGDTASLFGYELLDENYSPVPTDRDIGDLRFTNMSYTTDDQWPETI